MKNVVDYLIYFVVRICICVIQSVRIETCDYACRWLAWFVTDWIAIRREIVDENLFYAFPNLSDAQRRMIRLRMWHHLFLMGCEIFQVPRKIHETNWRRFLYVRDIRAITRSLLATRPTVVVSGHFGNFEVACFFLGLLGVPTFAIARPLDNPYLDRYINRKRTSTSSQILPKQGGADQGHRILEARGVLALLGDQHAGPKGCWVDFFGRPASCHKAIALFSLTTGAPLLVSYAMRRGGPLQFEVGLEGEMDPKLSCPESESVRALTQWYCQRLEAIVRMAPDQYWWVHRRWRKPPRADRSDSQSHAA